MADQFNGSDLQEIQVDYESQAIERENVRAFFSNVFALMFGALAITGLTAYILSGSEAFLNMLYDIDPASGQIMGVTTLFYILAFAPLGLVLLFNMALRNLSLPVLLFFFLLFSLVMGASMSSIFLVYTGASIFLTFVVTSATFGVMAVIGYTTKTDLTKMGKILMMAVIGLVIATVANFFMQSLWFDYVVSGIGVIVFTGLIAYHMQKLKNIASGVEYGSGTAMRLAMMGAFSLYLDFINLFLFLLRFLGNRN